MGVVTLTPGPRVATKFPQKTVKHDSMHNFELYKHCWCMCARCWLPWGRWMGKCICPHCPCKKGFTL